NQKQEEVQKRELYELRKSHESIEIMDIKPSENISSTDRWSSFNFTLASLHEDNSTITMITVNDEPVRRGDMWRFDRGEREYHPEEYSYTNDTYLKGMERAFLDITVNESFFSEPTFLKSHYVKIEVITSYSNDFSKVFMPPTSVVEVEVQSQWNSDASDYDQYLILDGSGSDHPGEGYMVQWSWHLENTTGSWDQDLTGRKVRADLPESGTYYLNLTVVDNFGMEGFDSLTYNYQG
ncbi:MAG: hypothetical protein ACLFPN_00925, partial [Methanomassiliicoccales archaeon]